MPNIHVDDQGNFISGEAHGNKIEQVSEGIKITRPSGMQLMMNDDGSITLLTPPKSVGIRDLSEVKSYTIEKNGDGPIHHIEFLSGGNAQVAFTTDGQFKDISGTKLMQCINKDDELLLGPSKNEE